MGTYYCYRIPIKIPPPNILHPTPIQMTGTYLIGLSNSSYYCIIRTSQIVSFLFFFFSITDVTLTLHSTSTFFYYIFYLSMVIIGSIGFAIRVLSAFGLSWTTQFQDLSSVVCFRASRFRSAGDGMMWRRIGSCLPCVN